MRILKSILCLILVFLTVASAAGCQRNQIRPKSKEFWGYFHTDSCVYSYAGDSDKEFSERCRGVSEILSEYHKMFDIYNEYQGINNLCTVNKNAGGEPVSVDGRLIDFLLYAKELYELTGGEMNVMMGSVLRLWHNCRSEAKEHPENAKVPTSEELSEAALHTDISLLEIDRENSTVRITDPAASIDVGALGKGYATEKAAEYLEGMGAQSYVLDIGGNLRIIGKKPDGSGWITGVRDPFDLSGNAERFLLSDISCVTSGDYERYYTVDGKKYHHIIDKDTLMPAEYFSSVTVLTADSGLADALSTALFAMSYEDGLLLLEKLDCEVEVFWIGRDKAHYESNGLEKYKYVK